MLRMKINDKEPCPSVSGKIYIECRNGKQAKLNTSKNQRKFKLSATWFNVKLTKQIFAGFFKKAIPVVGVSQVVELHI